MHQQEDDAELPQLSPRAHRRQHLLHDPNRVHGAQRYQAPPRDLGDGRQAGGHDQYYQYHWETEENRWVWLRPHRIDRRRAVCIACHMDFEADIVTVRGHENSNRHLRNIDFYNIPMDDERDHHLTREEFEVEKATIKILLAAYFCSEGIAYRKIDTLLPLIKRIARYPGALQEIKLSRWDISKIIKKTVAPSYKQELTDILTHTKFTILYDDSTSIDKDKHGCLLVRVAHAQSYRILTLVFDIIQIYRPNDDVGDETAQSLYNNIIRSMFEPLGLDNNGQNQAVIPRENLMALGSDGCNVMIGAENSVARRFHDNFPGFRSVVCPCHGSALCERHSSEEIPIIQELLVAIYNWFCSSKRLHRLRQNQIHLDMSINRILRFVNTRWLTRLPALIRIDEQMQAIQAALAEEPLNEQAVNLHILLQSPIIRCLIKFFIFILEVIEDFNGFMQTEEVVIPEVYARIKDDYRDILLCYMHIENIENIIQVNPEDEELFRADDEMLIGDDARQIAQQLPREHYPAVMRLIRQYLIRLATEWVDRLVIPWGPYRCLEALFMHNALSVEYRAENPEAIQDLAFLFPRAVPHNVDVQVLQALYIQLALVLQNVQLPLPPANTVKTEQFWFFVKHRIVHNRIHPFRELAEFALNILSTPHSNAQPERIWSFEKYLKNKYRNQLSLASVKATFYTKEYLKLHRCENELHNFIPTAEMIRIVRFRLFDAQPNEPQVINENDEMNDSDEGQMDGEEWEDDD